MTLKRVGVANAFKTRLGFYRLGLEQMSSVRSHTRPPLTHAREAQVKCRVRVYCALTEKRGGGHGSVAAGHHDTDPRFNEGHGEVDDL